MDQNVINDSVARYAARLDGELPGWHHRADTDAIRLAAMDGFEASYETSGGVAAWAALVAARRNVRVRVLLAAGWLLSRDFLGVISPGTGRWVAIDALFEAETAEG